MKKALTLLLLVCFMGTAEPAKNDLVGITMPTKDLERWVLDGKYLKDAFEKKGYRAELQYAGNEVIVQLNQIEEFINEGAKVLIITAVDGASLTEMLSRAKDRGIKVIAYDRLIMQSPNVDYYVTFDNFQVGVLEGRVLERALKLNKGAKGPFNFEVFGGSPEDNNARYFYDGAWSVLSPYVKKGALKIPSGQEGWPRTGIEGWSTERARERMSNLLAAYYGKGEKLDAVLSPNDSVALGIITALKEAGYRAGSKTKPFPVIDGQDCDRANVRAIWDGEQAACVFKNTKTLANRAVKITDDILSGKMPQVNDTKTYDNGVKVVPAYLETPATVYKADIKRELIDSGYYKVADVNIKF